LSDLTTYAITRRWQPKDPSVIQLYSLPTPNGVKVSIALEELGLAYEAHRVDFAQGDQHSAEYLSLNPNGKIPAIIDPDGPGGKPLPLFESGAILLYLAEKTGKLLPAGGGRWEAIQWLMFQMGGVGPMFGQVGYFHHFAGKEIDDPRPRTRYYNEARRLLAVLDQRMAGRDWIVGDYSIADISICPWVRNLRDSYDAGDETGLAEMPNVLAWLDRFLARPAVVRGLKIPARP
jgi:GST-like protein